MPDTPSISAQVLLLKPRDAAKMLSICERTLWALSARGELRQVKIGRAVRYSVDELRAFIQRQEGGEDDPQK